MIVDEVELELDADEVLPVRDRAVVDDPSELRELRVESRIATRHMTPTPADLSRRPRLACHAR